MACRVQCYHSLGSAEEVLPSKPRHPSPLAALGMTANTWVHGQEGDARLAGERKEITKGGVESSRRITQCYHY